MIALALLTVLNQKPAPDFVRSWTHETNSIIRQIIPLKGRLIVGTWQSVGCVDAQSGNSVWKAPLANGYESSIALYKDILLVHYDVSNPTSASGFYALNSDT